MKEKTGKQDLSTQHVITRSGASELEKNLTLSYAERRKMRTDPTIALGRAFSVAPILIATWSVQAEVDVPDDWVQHIRDTFLPHRLGIMNHALFSSADFGWAPFEVVYAVVDGRTIVKKFKPLLQDITTILVDKHGAPVGLEQASSFGEPIVLRGDSFMLLSFRAEGTMWHGTALMENAYNAYKHWNEANAGAARYDKKIAGSHFVVYYPPGKCLDETGAEIENHEMAVKILRALESSGCVAVPSHVLEQIEDLNQEQMDVFRWKIDVLEDEGGRQGSFIARLKYLDVLKIRAFIMPERSMVEGSHGTLAEAEAHLDLALTYMDFTNFYITHAVNKIVNVVLRANWGKSAVGKVWLTPSSLVDERKAYLQRMYLTILSKAHSDVEANTIDLDTVKDLLGVPKIDKVT